MTGDPSALERVRGNFPTIYLTLHSIIIAVVLEALWQPLGAKSVLPTDPLLWMQALVYVSSAFNVWLHTSLFGSSMPGVLTPREAAMPFALLILFSAMLATMGSLERAPWWFYSTGTLFMTAYPAWRIWERAHEDDPGSFEGIGVYRGASRVNVGNAVFLFAAGAAVHLGFIGAGGAAILCAPLIALTIVGSLVWVRGWRRAIGLPS